MRSSQVPGKRSKVELNNCIRRANQSIKLTDEAGGALTGQKVAHVVVKDAGVTRA